MRMLAVTIAGVALLLGVACGGGNDVVPSPTGPPVADDLPEGRQLFTEKGCAACHGANAEGTNIAPALPGHNAEQVKRAARNPMGNMPRFGLELINDAELAKIGGYIESLERTEQHVEPVDMENALAIHHLMALESLESGNPDEAEHHVGHIIETVTDAAHKSQMEDVLQDVRSGDDHDASHAIEEMLILRTDTEFSMKQLHLQLALTSIGADKLDDAKHHVEHFIELVTGHDAEHAGEAIDLLGQGNADDASHEIEELLE